MKSFLAIKFVSFFYVCKLEPSLEYILRQVLKSDGPVSGVIKVFI